MTGATRNVARFIFGAGEAVAVRIAARTTDAMTAHAQLLPRSAMTARARHGIDPSLRAVITTSG